MEQILDIGDGKPPAEDEEVQAPRKVVSGTIPFMDISPYTADNSTPNDPEPRLKSHLLNYFKARRRIGADNVQERLKRVN